MEPMWTIDVANRTFTRSVLCPEDLVWHESVFSGNGEGIIDRGGPAELARLKQLKEVEGIHPIIREDPNYFFDLEGAVWAYTGKVGEAPDFIGFSSPNIIHIGEIKWQRGWAPELLEQIDRYTSRSTWLGNTEDKHLTVHIACPQTASRALVSKICCMLASRWSKLEVRFGFFQLGWSKASLVKGYLRVVWVNGDRWDGTEFRECRYVLGLHG